MQIVKSHIHTYGDAVGGASVPGVRVPRCAWARRVGPRWGRGSAAAAGASRASGIATLVI